MIPLFGYLSDMNNNQMMKICLLIGININQQSIGSNIYRCNIFQQVIVVITQQQVKILSSITNYHIHIDVT